MRSLLAPRRERWVWLKRGTVARRRLGHVEAAARGAHEAAHAAVGEALRAAVEPFRRQPERFLLDGW